MGQDLAEGVNVRRRTCALRIGRLLRCHVSQGPELLGRSCERRPIDIDLLGDPEVGDDRDAGREQDVARLQVAVKNAAVVCMRDTRHDVPEDADSPALIRRAAVLNGVS